MIVDFVTIDGVRANIGAGSASFPGYFDVDSMSVLLGKNGSGKTHLLQTVAEALTHGASVGDQGHWAGREADGSDVGADAVRPPARYGVVYYTALPFQRRMSPHPRFVDASNIPSTTLRKNMFEQYDWIAGALGEPSRLRAQISFREEIVEKLVVNVLLETSCELFDPELERIRREAIERHTSSEAASLESEFRFKLFDRINNSLGSRGLAFHWSALATLDYQTQRLNRRADAVMAFLEEFELAKLPEARTAKEQRQRQKTSDDFRDVFHNTRLIFDSLQGASEVREAGTVGIEFDAKAYRDVNLLVSRKNAVRLAWSNLSSGFLSLVEQFARLYLSVRRLANRRIKSILLLLDESDAYLHLDWQRQYIEHLNTFLAQLKGAYRLETLQVLIATHSPVISGDFPAPMVQRLGGEDRDFKTFGNSLDTLVFEAFETDSIGSFAAKKVRELRRRVVSRNLSDGDLRLINEIGDEGLKRAVLALDGGSQA
ncbi:hypothetical protein PTKU46_58690 [Paraburkholderia terrae]|uniref:AAA family ATPase n=1 Tax=Paraburkholderia terrae TaxID=311230 RepID=UPI0030E1764D